MNAEDVAEDVTFHTDSVMWIILSVTMRLLFIIYLFDCLPSFSVSDLSCYWHLLLRLNGCYVALNFIMYVVLVDFSQRCLHAQKQRCRKPSHSRHSRALAQLIKTLTPDLLRDTPSAAAWWTCLISYQTVTVEDLINPAGLSHTHKHKAHTLIPTEICTGENKWLPLEKSDWFPIIQIYFCLIKRIRLRQINIL